MDEISLRKGHQDYVVVFVDLDTHNPIGLAPSRKQADMLKVLERWGSEVLENILEVSIDMSGNYRGFVKKHLPNADVVADRFHVMKLVNDELNRARNQLKRDMNAAPEMPENEAIKQALKQSKYALLKPEENLTGTQRDKLEEIKEASPQLAEMHHLKERFRTIFEESSRWSEALFDLLDWMVDAKVYFSESVETIGRWFGEIINYFEHRTTNGIVEGINNRLKLIKRLGFGFSNFENFEIRCLMCWNLNMDSA